MRFSIVIPCHNEADYIGKTLQSLIEQTLLPKQIIVVDDQSTDTSREVISAFAKAYSFITVLHKESEAAHLPGSKVVAAFQTGFEMLDDDSYDIICKFDADLIFPKNYLEKIAEHFTTNPNAGIAGGFCYIKKDGIWKEENLTNKDHVRGALKAYRKACFKDIGGLKPAMGWDTIDEMLARYNDWTIVTDQTLEVKHLKPTGNTYTQAAKFKQGEAFYGMRYGFWLTAIASGKLAFKKGKFSFFKDYMRGYFRAKRTKKSFLVSPSEGKFIRNLRWSGIKEKLFKS